MNKEESKTEKHEDQHHGFIEVEVYTTSGSYPTDGYERVPVNQKVDVMLKKAAKAIGLTSTDGWIATVNKQQIDPHKSYQDNGLSNQVTIDWGPSEGGGGNA